MSKATSSLKGGSTEEAGTTSGTRRNQEKFGSSPESKKANIGFLEKASGAPGNRSTIRSRIAVAQEGRLPSRLDLQHQLVMGSSNGATAESRGETLEQHRVSDVRPLSKSESSIGTAAPHEDAPNSTTPEAVFTPSRAKRTIHAETPFGPPVIEKENLVTGHPHKPKQLKTSDLTCPPGAPGAVGGATASNAQKGAQKMPTESGLSPRSWGRQSGQNMVVKERGGGPEADERRGARTPSGGPAAGSAALKPDAAMRSAAAGHRNSGEARGSSLLPAAARTGYVLDSHGATGDTTTTDTRETLSRSRLSAQVLRGLMESSDKKLGGAPGRQPITSGMPSNRFESSEKNPLRQATRIGNANTGVGNAEMQLHSSFGHRDGTSFTQSSSTQIEVRADDLHAYADDVNSNEARTLTGEQPFTKRRGEVEWLRTPSLFYFFANVIKWNELQLQRKALQSSWQARQHHSSRTSLSLVSVWTQHRERELRTLEAHISFSAFELEGVYLNRLLMSWSKPELRSLVEDVVGTWKKEGPCSTKFDTVSSHLFDAISSEESCQLRGTWVLSVRQWLGQSHHRWINAAMLLTCVIVAILCIVFLAVFGRTREVVCIVLSVVLGVVVIMIYVIAMFTLHHNTYAAAAATFFREAAVRAAQQKMEEEELEGVDDLSDASSYFEDDHEKYEEPGNHHGIESLTNIDESESHSNYTAEQTSLAVRNLLALTEGTAHPASPGAPYYHIPSNLPGEKRGSGLAAGGYYDDDMTLTDLNAPSVNSRPLPVGGNAKQQQELDRDNTLLLSTTTYAQHQENLKQRQAQLVQETMSSSRLRDVKEATGNDDRLVGRRTDDKERIDGGSGVIRSSMTAGTSSADMQAGLRQLAELPDKVNITALIFCNNAGVLAGVAPSLWERMFVLLRVGDLHALDNAFKHGSKRFKVILIYASDAPDGSEVLRTALKWLQVERRPVFFMARQSDAYAHHVPPSARLHLPFNSATLDTLLLAGIGVEAELGSVSFPALLQQEQSPSQPFQVPPYVLGRRLGGGAFGNVFEAEMEQSGGKCAVKRMYLKEDSDEGGQDEHGGRDNNTANTSAGVSVHGEAKSTAGDTSHTASSEMGEAAGETASNPDVDDAAIGVGSQLREIAQEVEIMSSLQHPNIVRYYFCERDDNCISIFMELCTGGSLSSLIHSGRLVNPPEIKLLLREIISAVAYLHSLRIVHRDLKPDNVLFRQGHAKITDFGTAVHKHGGDLRLIKGTFAYMAPETLVGEPYGSACDVWSIGCIAAEVLSVELPQHALGLPAMCEYYRSMGKDSTLPIECEVPGVLDFLLACLRRDASERSTAAELFYHPVLQARDTSIQSWMQKVVEQRRHKHILQHKMSHRIGPGGRGNGGVGGASTVPNSQRASNVVGVDGGDGFDLSSGNGNIISLDSSQLTGHEEREGSLLSS